MRHLLFALLVALLPLRGWVGDAMATQMAAGQLQQAHPHQQVATKTIAEHHGSALAAAHFDHEEVANAPAAAEPDCAGHSTAGDGQCESCAACQACHTVALSLASAGAALAFTSLNLTHPLAEPFASADAALRRKPPIS